MKKLILLFVIISSMTNLVNAQWNQCDGPYGGIIMTLFSSNDTLFAGTNKGLYISFDNVNYWAKILDYGISDICINYQGVLFISTWSGLFTSNDWGTSWTQVNTPFPYSNEISINSLNEIFAATDYGLFISTDNGNTWIQNVGLSNNTCKSIEIDSNNNIYISVNQQIFKSLDNGNTWINTNFPTNLIGKLFINSSNQIFVCCSYYGLYRSNDNGITWNQIFNNEDVQAVTTNQGFS